MNDKNFELLCNLDKELRGTNDENKKIQLIDEIKILKDKILNEVFNK